MGASLVFLESPNKNIEFDSGEDQKMKYCAGEMQGWRLNMEDAQISNLQYGKDQAMFGVFDGHGGKEVARYCKNHFEDTLQKNETFKKKETLEGLRQSFLKLDEMLVGGGLKEVAQLRRDEPPNKSPLLKVLSDAGNKKDGDEEDLQLDSIGCTANVVMVDHERRKLYVANAGDSRAVMGQGGKAVPLSFDHKPEDQIEIDRIHKAGSVITDGRVDGNLNLTRAIGDLKYKQKSHLKPEEHPITSNPDVFEYDITDESDFIIMGCDGVWEQKSNDEMVEWVYSRLGKDKDNANLNDIVTELLNENLAEEVGGSGCDNMTCILIIFK